MRTARCTDAATLARLHCVSRRGVLVAGVAPLLHAGGVSALLSGLPAAAGTPERSVIVLWLSGGPSQHDTFDPKPEAPAEIRSPFSPIETSAPGIRVTELFPRIARQAHRFALLRSVYHTLDDHARGMCWLLSGRLHDSIKYPNIASVVNRLSDAHSGLPAAVNVPRLNLVAGLSETDHAQTAGDLGALWSPLTPAGVPGYDGFGIPDLQPPPGVRADRFERRARLLGRAQDSAGELQAQALDLVRSDRIRSAFDLDREPDILRDRYGRHGFGQSTLLARRLVEHGVRYVTVNWPNYYQWDHHLEFAGRMQYQAPVLDFALSALLEDLHQRGRLESTLVLCMGEFGRTPKINVRAGRDHWVHVMTVLAAGGGIRGGVSVGSSDADGAYPADRPIHAREVAATIYDRLGIPAHQELMTRDGRPFQVLPDGEPIHELLARA